MRPLALLFECVLAAVGAVGIFSPAQLAAAMRVVATPAGLYGIGALRIGMGLVLFWSAATSRVPRVLRAFGVLFVVAGLATPLLGVERTRALVDYGSTHGGPLIRVAGTVILAFGAFVAYAVTPRRPA